MFLSFKDTVKIPSERYGYIFKSGSKIQEKSIDSMGKFDDIFKKLDRQKYPFIDGLYYLFIIIFIGLLFLFFA